MNERNIFIAALKKPNAVDRAAFLDDACGSNADLRREVEALICEHEQLGSFLESPAVPRPSSADDPIREGPGTLIGSYKLLEQIGEGGFGVVFMAEQQHPLRRKVALKVLKPGMDTRQVVARFEAERQALALMDHPNIAHVFDGGETASGRPYFVMELVKGLPITEFSDQDRLNVRERLELFVTVCQAVQHAHQKGIIHRDLKPSNVLVTLHDGTPAVKIIDFGIAKATGQQLTEKTLFTNFAQLVGTPLYMSPEQAALSALDVDTRSDIYSLGVLLYELLTGTTPFDKERLRTSSFDEIRRIIREEEPPKPSTRISTLGHAAATLSTQRKSDPNGLSQLFRGELDWIVMKCLEKDRNRRYETASTLARDIERYLHDEPVQACPPSAAYRFRKFARRNRTMLAAGTLVAGVLVLGTVVSLWLAVRALDAEGLAAKRLVTETEARQAADAERDTAKHRLFDARLTQARAARWSGRIGQRFESWKALTEAAEIARELELDESRLLELRNEAIACLALMDVRLVKEWPGSPAGTGDAMSFDANFEHYARCDAKGLISVRRVADDQELARLDSGRRGHASLLLSPDGNLLVGLNDWHLTMLVWDWRRGGIVFQLGPPEKTYALFTPDSRQLAVSQADGTITLFEVGTWKVLRRCTVDFRPGSIALHPDGAKVAIGGDRRVDVRGWASGELLRRLDHPERATATWHPNGKVLAVGCADSNVYLWDAATGRQHAILQGHQGSVTQVAFSLDGGLLFTTAWDGISRIWDPWSGRQLLGGLAALAGNSEAQYSHDGRRLVTRSGEKLSLWEVHAGFEYSCLPEVSRIAGYGTMAISPDGSWLAAAHNSGVELRELPGGSVKAFLPLGHTAGVMFHPNGGQLFTSGAIGVHVWPLRTDGRALRIGPPRSLAKGTCGRLSLDQRGRLLTVVMGGGGRILDLEHPSEVITFPHHNIHGVAASPDGRWVASGCMHGQGVKIWDAQNGRLVQDLAPDAEWSVAVFSPDGQWLATSTDEGFGVWDVRTWQRVRLVRAQQDNPHAGVLAFSSDGKVLALSTARHVVQLVDPATGRLFATLQAPASDWVRSICFSPDGSRLAVATTIHKDQAVLRMWDLRRIREQLQEIGLDWDLPAYPPPAERDTASPMEVKVDLGDLAAILRPNDPRYDLALSSLVVALNPFNFQAYLRRGHAYAELGEVQKAAEDYRRSAALMPAHLRRCSARFVAVVEDAGTLRDYVKAVGDLVQSLGSTEANNLAWHLVTGREEARDPVKALALAERAVASRPGDGILLNTLGVVYYRLGWYEQARATLERSLPVNSAKAHDLYFLAMCHARRGDRDRARECYDHAVQWVHERQGKMPAGWNEELAVFRAEAAELLGVREEN
jgi:serine/threonine protein kinase/WD40 repeat protein/tetratricopeptide (TPR) repeat protein